MMYKCYRYFNKKINPREKRGLSYNTTATPLSHTKTGAKGVGPCSPP